MSHRRLGVEGRTADALPTLSSVSYRLLLGAGTAVCISLLIASLNLAWWHYQAILKQPSFDGGITMSNGGVGLTWRQHCENYSNHTFQSGTPLLAAQLCVVEEMDLSQPAPTDLNAHNRGTVVTFAFAIAACGVVLYLLAFAPSKPPVWTHLVAAAATTPSALHDGLVRLPWQRRLLLHATYWHDRITTLLALEYGVPLLLTPCAIAIIVQGGQYSQDAGSLPVSWASQHSCALPGVPSRASSFTRCVRDDPRLCRMPSS